jgi:hypothetical protein
MPFIPDYTNITSSCQSNVNLQPPEPKVQALLFEIIAILFAAATLIVTAIAASRRTTVENLPRHGIYFCAKEICGMFR